MNEMNETSTDLSAIAARLLEARARANKHDFEQALEDIRQAIALPGPMRCAWCKRIMIKHYIADPLGSDGICPRCRDENFSQVRNA